jgi:hypothetical protein
MNIMDFSLGETEGQDENCPGSQRNLIIDLASNFQARDLSVLSC